MPQDYTSDIDAFMAKKREVGTPGAPPSQSDVATDVDSFMATRPKPSSIPQSKGVQIVPTTKPKAPARPSPFSPMGGEDIIREAQQAKFDVSPELRAKQQQALAERERYEGRSVLGQRAEDVTRGAIGAANMLAKVGAMAATPSMPAYGGIAREGVLAPAARKDLEQRSNLARQVAPFTAPVTEGLGAAAVQAPAYALMAPAGIPGIAALTAAQEDFVNDPKRAAVRTLAGSVIPVGAGRLAARLAQPATAAGRIGTETVGGAVANPIQSAVEQQAFEGRIDPGELARQAVIGGVASGATAVPAARGIQGARAVAAEPLPPPQMQPPATRRRTEIVKLDRTTDKPLQAPPGAQVPPAAGQTPAINEQQRQAVANILGRPAEEIEAELNKRAGVAQPKPAAVPAQPGQQENLQAVGQAGQAIVGNMYDSLFSDIEAGKTINKAGVADNFLIIAKAIKDNGGMLRREDLPGLGQEYAAIEPLRGDPQAFQQAAMALIAKRVQQQPELTEPIEEVPDAPITDPISNKLRPVPPSRPQQELSPIADEPASPRAEEPVPLSPREQAREQRNRTISAGRQSLEEARQRTQQAIDEGRFDDAIAEVNVERRALRDLLTTIKPDTPGATKLRAQLTREAGHAGNRIGEIRKMKSDSAKQAKLPTRDLTEPQKPIEQPREDAPTVAPIEQPQRQTTPLQEPTNRITQGEGGELQRYSKPLEGQPIEIPAKRPETGPLPEEPQAIRDLPPVIPETEAFRSPEDARRAQFEPMDDAELEAAVRTLEDKRNLGIREKAKLSPEEQQLSDLDLRTAKTVRRERLKDQRALGKGPQERLEPYAGKFRFKDEELHKQAKAFAEKYGYYPQDEATVRAGKPPERQPQPVTEAVRRQPLPEPSELTDERLTKLIRDAETIRERATEPPQDAMDWLERARQEQQRRQGQVEQPQPEADAAAKPAWDSPLTEPTFNKYTNKDVRYLRPDVKTALSPAGGKALRNSTYNELEKLRNVANRDLLPAKAIKDAAELIKEADRADKPTLKAEDALNTVFPEWQTMGRTRKAELEPPKAEQPAPAQPAPTATKPGGWEYQHKRFGKLREAEDQSGVRRGQLRMIDEKGEMRIVKRATGGTGNRDAVAMTKAAPEQNVSDAIQSIKPRGGLVSITDLRAKGVSDQAILDASERGEIALQRGEPRIAQPGTLLDDGQGNQYVGATLRTPEETAEIQAAKPQAKARFSIGPDPDETSGGQVLGMGLGALGSGSKARAKQVGRDILEIIKGSRALMTSADLSAPLRQGLPYTLPPQHWAKAARASGRMFRAVSAKNYQQIKAKMEEDPYYQLAEYAGLHLGTRDPRGKQARTREEVFSAEAIRKIPIVKQIVGGSEQAYTTYLDSLRLDRFGEMAEAIKKSTATPEQREAALKAAADWINIATGRGKVGPNLAKHMETMSAVMFAPRYTLSRFQMLNPVTYMKLYKDNPTVARQAVTDMATTAVAVGALLGMAKYLGGADIGLDPSDADFLKMRFGNTRYDLGAGTLQWMRLLYNTGNWLVSQASNDEWGREEKRRTMARNIETFSRSKLAPIPSFAVDMFKGKTVTGEKTDALEGVTERMLPIFWKDWYEAVQKEGLGKGTAKNIPAFFGVGVQNYERLYPPFKEGKLGAETKRLGLGSTGIDRLKDESDELFTAREKRHREMSTKYGEQLIDSSQYKSASSELQKKMLDLFKRDISEMSNQKQPKLAAVNPARLLARARQSARDAQREQRKGQREKVYVPPPQ